MRLKKKLKGKQYNYNEGMCAKCNESNMDVSMKTFIPRSKLVQFVSVQSAID